MRFSAIAIRSGFSLVEILVTVGIITILAVIGIPVSSSCLESARAAREIAGARGTVAAWAMYASENNGTVLPGYLSMTQAAAADVRNAAGAKLVFPTSSRYVFRLAPYLNYQLKGSVLVNKQAKLTSDYEISVSPSIGLNLTFVGGDFGSGSDLPPTAANLEKYGKFVVTNINEIHSPGKLLVFASGRFDDPTWGKEEGYNAVKSPYWSGKRWLDTWDEDKPYYEYGGVAFRFNKRAVCAMADGHVELLSIDQLMDMRRWSNQAAMDDNPNWTFQSQP